MSRVFPVISLLESYHRTEAPDDIEVLQLDRTILSLQPLASQILVLEKLL